jgi:hypothetical protein
MSHLQSKFSNIKCLVFREKYSNIAVLMCMLQGLHSRVDICSGSIHVLHLRKPKVNYCGYKCSPFLSGANYSLQSDTTISLKYILILSSHLGLGLRSGIFPSRFWITVFHSFLISPMHVLPSSLLAHHNTCWGHKLYYSSLCSLCTVSILPSFCSGRKNLNTTLFSNAQNLCPFLRAGNQTSHWI